MRTVYVVAHPEAEHHLSRVVGGWHDSELTDCGRAQATLIATRLRELVPDEEVAQVYTSDLRRASQTAEAIAAALGAELAYDKRLRERSYGIAEGKPQAWLDERFVPPPADGDRMHHHEGVGGAETRYDLAVWVYVRRSGMDSHATGLGGLRNLPLRQWRNHGSAGGQLLPQPRGGDPQRHRAHRALGRYVVSYPGWATANR